jgi:hypothetical protein
MRVSTLLLPLLALACIGGVAPTWAQAPAEPGTLRLAGDVRLLSGAPGDPVYGSLNAEKGLREGRSVVVWVVTPDAFDFFPSGTSFSQLAALIVQLGGTPQRNFHRVQLDAKLCDGWAFSQVVSVGTPAAG